MEDKRTELMRTQVGVSILAATLVKTLNETDTTFQDRFLKNLTAAHYKLRDDTPGIVQEQMELLTCVRELITGFSHFTGQGEPFFPED